MFYSKYFTDAMRAIRKVEFSNLKEEEMFVGEDICRFDELSWYAPHIVASNKLEVDQSI